MNSEVRENMWWAMIHMSQLLAQSRHDPPYICGTIVLQTSKPD